MATNLGTLIYELSLDSKEFMKAITDSEASVESVGKKLDSFGESAKKVGEKLSIGVTLPIVALGTAAIKMAGDAEAAANKFNKVFSSSISQASDAVKDLVKNYGLSTDEAQKMMVSTGGLAKSMGASSSEAASMAQKIAQIAVDMAIF